MFFLGENCPIPPSGKSTVVMSISPKPKAWILNAITLDSEIL